MKDGFFEEGDVVQHKCSKQKGIVVGVSETCTEHQDWRQCMSILAKCNFVPDGKSYTVSTGFGDPVDVQSFLLELVAEGAK